MGGKSQHVFGPNLAKYNYFQKKILIRILHSKTLCLTYHKPIFRENIFGIHKGEAQIFKGDVPSIIPNPETSTNTFWAQYYKSNTSKWGIICKFWLRLHYEEPLVHYIENCISTRCAKKVFMMVFLKLLLRHDFN